MIRLDNISKQNGHQLLFIDASAALQKGEKVGLVGPNGAGKTTLFRLITGEEQPDEGQVAVERGVTIGYFSQDVGEMAGRSAVAEVMDGAGPVSEVAAELHALEAAMADPDRADEMDAIVARYGEVQARFEELDGYALEGRAREVLAGLSFSQEMMDGDVGALSGGWKMRVALARILLMRPDAMLLDEPSNHLDLESLIWLEQFLKGYEGALLMTSHDWEFMNRIVNKVVEIDGGTLTSYSGNYEFYEAQRALNEKQQQAQFERQQAMLAKEIKFIERFKARASHAAQVQSRVKKLEKIERVEPPRRRQTVVFDFPPAPRSGEDVVSLKKVDKRYGSRIIYQGFDFMVRRRERWCVMGVNGAGKSTLLKLVAGATEPDDGSVTLGGSVKLGYFAQHAMDLLDGERTVFQSLEDSFPQAGQGSLRALAGCFGFSGDDVEKRCRVLSGGEKARLVMALMLYDPPNFLVLDEPTNHLDIATKEMLIAALSELRRRDAVRLARPALPRRAVQPSAGAHPRGHPPVWRRLHRIRRAHRPRGARPAVVGRATTPALLLLSGTDRTRRCPPPLIRRWRATACTGQSAGALPSVRPGGGPQTARRRRVGIALRRPGQRAGPHIGEALHRLEHAFLVAEPGILAVRAAIPDRLVSLDLQLLDQSSIFHAVFPHGLRELGGAAADRFLRGLPQRCANRRIGENLVDLAIEALHDRGGCLGRHEHAEPLVEDQVGNSGFPIGRHVGQARRARFARLRQKAQRARSVVRDQRGHPDRADLHMAGNQIIDRRPSAPIGHGLQRDSGDAREPQRRYRLRRGQS